MCVCVCVCVCVFYSFYSSIYLLFIYSFTYFSCLATIIHLLISLFPDLTKKVKTSVIIIHLFIYRSVYLFYPSICVWGGGGADR